MVGHVLHRRDARGWRQGDLPVAQPVGDENPGHQNGQPGAPGDPPSAGTLRQQAQGADRGHQADGRGQHHQQLGAGIGRQPRRERRGQHRDRYEEQQAGGPAAAQLDHHTRQRQHSEDRDQKDVLDLVAGSHREAIVARQPHARGLHERNRPGQMTEVCGGGPALRREGLAGVLGEVPDIREVHREGDHGDGHPHCGEAPHRHETAALNKRDGEQHATEQQPVGRSHRAEHVQQRNRAERHEHHQPQAELAVERLSGEGGAGGQERHHQQFLDRTVQPVAIEQDHAQGQHARHRRGHGS